MFFFCLLCSHPPPEEEEEDKENNDDNDWLSDEEEEACTTECVFESLQRGRACLHGRQACRMCSDMVEGGSLCSDCFS